MLPITLSAQQVELSIKNGTLAGVVAQLQQKLPQYRFSFQQEVLEKVKVADLNLKAPTLTDLLDRLKSRFGLQYWVDGMFVSFKYSSPKDSSAPDPKNENGLVTGKIIDEETSQPVSGVSIRINKKGTVTGDDGSFTLSLPAGSYAAQISYVGYIGKEVSGILIKPNEYFTLNITLKRQKGQLAEVVVKSSARKESVNAHYARQKNAASVTDGISAEQIARTPDNDMGQSLKRISGLTTVSNKSVVVRGMSDRYNQAMLDGVVIPSTSMNKRNFSFDIIPTEMVSNVVVNKTATPDMSSEFSGGQVSINTLDIPSANFTSISKGTGISSQAIGKDFYRMGERNTSEMFGFFHHSAKKPADLMPWVWNNDAIRLDAPPGASNDPMLDNWKLNFERPDLKYNDLDAIAQSKKLNADALKMHKYKVQPNQNYRFAVGRVYRLKNNMQFGFSASANIRNEQNIVDYNNVRGQNYTNSYIDSSTFGQNGAGKSYRFSSSSGLVGNLGLQGKSFRIALKNMYARTYSDNFNEAVRLDYRDETNRIRKELYQLPEAMWLQQHQLTGDLQLPGGIKFEGLIAVNKIHQEILDERKLQYRLSTRIGDKYYFQTPNLLKHSSYSNNTVALDSRMWTNIDEMDYNWGANFSKIIAKESSFKTLIKMGYQGWTKKRSLDVFRMLPMTRSAKAGEILPEIQLPYEVLLSPDKIGAGTGQAYYYAENIGGRIFNGSMNSHAMYLMADQKLFGKLRLVYGARLEYYDLSNRQAELLRKRYGDNVPDYMKFQEGTKEQDWQLLPSINATYSFTNTLNLRASYSKTAIRPDFRETSFFGFYDYELDAHVSGQDVVSTLIDNYDVRLEWYPSPGEIISVTGYYKNLDKPIELVNNPAFQDGSYYVFANMAAAKNYGVELEIRKNLSFVADKSWLSDFFVYANGTLLKSKVDFEGPWQFRTVDGVIERFKDRLPGMDRPLIGQSPWLLNLGIGYWGEYFGATGSYNHRGYRSNLIRAEPMNIEFEQAPRLLDFQVYGRMMKKKLEVKLNIANILNEWSNYYVNAKGYETTTTGSGPREFRKLNGNNGYNKKDGDLIMYRSREGQRFSLTATYKF
ncbi:TonB-dependent receptor [Pseudoflavitalea sp. G-6-1-2]|uniref:TonB-dependent receptor n=1 Tax=Pseudoflavitalea sp. G-6-1-2 TaxID=2728841 RepID=UPI00146D4437|nr:TonB-dependent receptor [Pseudoflavitalea sp. G-6-1-2]NML24000.1 TonB-dependent receptor [Pseudoflavitalea sp. G-6-1-2]